MSSYAVSWQKRIAICLVILSPGRRELGGQHVVCCLPKILPMLLVSGKWYCIPYSDQLKLVPYIQEHLICGIFLFFVCLGKFLGCTLYAEDLCSLEMTVFWNDKDELSSVRPTLKSFQRQHLGNFQEVGWGKYRLSQVHGCHVKCDERTPVL